MLEWRAKRTGICFVAGWSLCEAVRNRVKKLWGLNYILLHYGAVGLKGIVI